MDESQSKELHFSLAEARRVVRDLFVADERIYWLDFLTTITAGYITFRLTRVLADGSWQPAGTSPAVRLALAAVAFAAQCACFYRAVMFVHEIVHLPERKLRLF